MRESDETAPPSIFFVHVMKTAGTALLRLTRDRYLPEECSPRVDLPVTTLEQKQSIDYLLDNGPALAKEYRLISAHVPAWVASSMAPDHRRVTLLRHPVDRTISQLRQTARRNDVDSIEAIFDDDHWRSRLSNYMTRVFGLRAEEHLQARAAVPQGFDINDLHEDERAEFVAEVKAAMDLAMYNRRPMTSDDLQRAFEALDTCTVVGTMNRFDEFLRDMCDLISVPAPPPRRVNVATNDVVISRDFRRRIEAELTLDLELYEAVNERRFS